MYRIDVGGRSILVAPCGAGEADLVRASIGADRTVVVLPAVQARLQAIEADAMGRAGRTRFAKVEGGRSDGCLPVEDAVAAVRASRAEAVMLAPMFPAIQPGDVSKAAARVWTGVATADFGVPVVVGEPGRSVSLAEAPQD